MELNYINGQTPIDEDEKEGLLISTVTTRGDLDEFEQYNIEKAVEWTLKNKFKIEKILTEKFIREVHKRMFGEVWKWAGAFRLSNKNIGVDKYQIAIELRNLIEDCKYWINNKTFENDEIAIRFKHRMVQIHLFPNGNGRHSRLCADIFISHVFNDHIFTWGGVNLNEKTDIRKEYLNAIYEADNNNNYIPLIKFARS